MRSIKFRFWHKKLGCYLGEEYSCYHFGPNMIEGEIDSDSCEIEQFTGLLDKKGTMIFEGDILKSTRAYRYMYNAGYIGAIKHREHFSDYEYGLLGGQITQTKAQYCEIIGTIHDEEFKDWNA